MTEKMMTEAQAVWFIRYATPQGFEECLTLRGDSGLELLDKAAAARKRLVDQGATPINRNNNHRSDQAGQKRVCPIHHVEMRARTKHGETWFSHKAVDPDTGENYWCRGEEKKS